MLMQMLAPRDILNSLAWPPGIFCCAKALGLGTHFGAKAPGCPGGMVTGQIDTCITEKSVGFTNVGLLRISESVRAYAYLILSFQASARSSIIGNLASSLTAQSAFLNNFENVVNRRVNIQEDIKH